MTCVRSLGSCTALYVRRGLNAVLYVARSRIDLNGLTSNPTVSVRIALSNLSLVSRRMAPVSAALSHTSPVRGDQTGTLTSAKDARLSDEPFILDPRSEEHTSELQSLMRISYAVFCLKKNKLNTLNIFNNT